MALSREQKRIIKLYKTPGHPIAFSAPNTIYRYFRGNIKLDTIKEALAHLDVYTLHREYKRPKFQNPYYSFLRRKDFQADLIDISTLAPANEGVRYLLIIIDIFSRRVWAHPLKRKTANETRDALRTWIDMLRNEGDSPAVFTTDNGTEFVNRQVKTLMRQNNIKMVQTANINKAAICERANKSIQILIYKYLTDRGEVTYIDKLPNIIETYNKRKHRTLNYISPIQADRIENQAKVRGIHFQRYSKINEKRPRKTKYKINDIVRIKTEGRAPSTVRRAYLQQFKGELFKIVRINTRMPIPMYILESTNDLEEIRGGFYSNELTLVKGDLFKIEKILRRRGQGRNRQFYVKWKYYDNRWNSWVNARDIVNPP